MVPRRLRPRPALLAPSAPLLLLLLVLVLLAAGGCEAWAWRGPAATTGQGRRAMPPDHCQPPARPRTRALATTMATAASSALPETPLAQPFAAVARARFSNGHYKEHQPVPHHVLSEVLRLTQRAPSSFNIQPYSLVVVRDPQVRARLAKEAMLGAWVYMYICVCIYI